MKNLAPLLTLALLSPVLLANAALPPDCRYSDGSRTLSDMNYYISDMLRFDDAYRRAASGSYEEQRASQARSQAASNAISYTNDLLNLSLIQIDDLQADMQVGYNAARSGSIVESTYKTIRDAAINSYEDKGNENIQCLYDDVLSIDLYASEFQSRYNAARSGSLIETANKNLRNAVYNRSEEVLRQTIDRMGRSELESLESQYAYAYQAASSGSRAESHARIMRDSLRNEILSRGQYPSPQPYPQPHYPQPQPHYPQPHPQPHGVCPPGTVYKGSLGRCVVPSRPVRPIRHR